MKPAISRNILLALLVLLGLGGLGSGAVMLADPSGALMGLPTTLLDGLPISNFVLPALFLSGVMGVAPLVIAYGLWRRLPWSWAATLTQGVVLILWIILQFVLWGAPIAIQWVYLAWGMVIVALCFAPGLRAQIRHSSPPSPQRPPELMELEAQFTKEVDPERAKNRQISNSLRSGRG